MEYRASTVSFLDNLTVALALLAFSVLFFSTELGVKTFYAASYLALLVVFLKWRQLKNHKVFLVMPVMLCLTGLSFLIWVLIFKQQSTQYLDIYSAYHNAGKEMIAGTFLCIALFNANSIHQIKNYFKVGVVILSLLVAGYAYYQAWYLHQPRIALNTDFATSAAYMISALGIIGLQIILQTRFSWKVYVFVAHFLIIYAALLLTATRAAILVYPLLSFLLFVMSQPNKKQAIKQTTYIILVSSLFVFVLFKNIYTQRADELINDLNQYQHANSSTSVGARLAMYSAGWHAGNMALLGQSADQRNQIIETMIQHQPDLIGIKPFLDIHLHNELIDGFSLRGIWGVLSIILLYGSCIWAAYRQKNHYFLGMSLLVIAYGLSDMIFYGKLLATTYILAFALCSFFCENRQANNV